MDLSYCLVRSGEKPLYQNMHLEQQTRILSHECQDKHHRLWWLCDGSGIHRWEVGVGVQWLHYGTLQIAVMLLHHAIHCALLLGSHPWDKSWHDWLRRLAAVAFGGNVWGLPAIMQANCIFKCTLVEEKPWSSSGRTESHEDVPFSLARSARCFCCGERWS